MCRYLHHFESHTELYRFKSKATVQSVQYNAKGTRLLCSNAKNHICVYDLSIGTKRQRFFSRSQLKLTAQDFTYNSRSIFNSASCCFAGRDDELVAAASGNQKIYIWAIPDGQGKRLIDRELLVLGGHQTPIQAVRYSPLNCALASSSLGSNTIKFWTPFQLPGPIGTEPDEPLIVEEIITISSSEEEDSSSNDDSPIYLD